MLSHPLRVRMIEELKEQELTVGTLKDLLEISSATASQQLSILRSHGIVVENRQGRNVYYHLQKPRMAAWILDGLEFVVPDQQEIQSTVSAIENARDAWSADPPKQKKPSKKPTKGRN